MTGCSNGEQYVWILPGWYDREWWYRDSCGQKTDNNTDCQPDKIRMGIDGYLMIRNQYFTTKAETEIIEGGLTVKEWNTTYHQYWQVTQLVQTVRLQAVNNWIMYVYFRSMRKD